MRLIRRSRLFHGARFGCTIAPVANCVACGWNLPFPFGGDCRESFSCQKCGQTLRARLRTRPFFLGICMIASVLFRAAFIIVNPRVNPDKTTKLTYLLERGMTRLLWRTRWVRVEIAEPRRVL